MIETRGLRKEYGGRAAVHGLDLTVGPGQLFGFLGPNGAGKTTTIKMMVGLLRPTGGSAAIAGHDIRHQTEAAKARLGYVPDSPVLYDKLTGREFLEFSGDLYHVERGLRDRRINTLLQLFELRDRGGDLVGGYSRGMRQKISLAAALLHDPTVLFLDEPTVGLDPRSARLMKDVLKDFCRADRCAFVSTHILEIAESMCSHVGIIDGGRLVTAGALADVMAQGAPGTSLEDMFLELTGGADQDKSALLAELEG
ncbi:MAG TPA: ABC transporter ATP-binding protein [Candidatus Dormibacteraeota bacterium]|nr:ABC transporter ATP-binding protein [Candidatus Dormibacteraeota bacterium]